MSNYKTLKKYTDDIPNEDYCCVSDQLIAISDGAGGCGVFASDWSKYLIDNLFDKFDKSPIMTFEDLDEWVGSIWEKFYNCYERKALEHDGIFLTKFYKEGSNATLAAVWNTEHRTCHWVAYGDSVIFHYRKSQNKLEYSFTKLSDFSSPPYLISCKDPLQKEGFHSGDYRLDDDSVVFVASDALSHYIMMIYYVTHMDVYKEEIQQILKNPSSEAQMLSIVLSAKNEFSFDNLISQLQDISRDQSSFDKFVKELHKRGVLEIDDFTLAFLKYDDSPCNIH